MGDRDVVEPQVHRANATNEYRSFTDLPEPLSAAIFAAAWRDAAGWPNPHSRKRLRLVCRQACAAVDGAVEKLSLWADTQQDLDACIRAVGLRRFPALREWHIAVSSHARPADGTIPALALAIPPALHKLDISGVHMDQPAAAALAGAPALLTLRQLRLCLTEMESAVLQVFAQGFGLRLELFNLEYSRVGSDGAGVLASVAAVQLQALRELELSHCGIGDTGVQALLQVTWGALEVLRLDFNSIGFQGAAALANAGVARLPALQHLGLGFNGLNDAGVAALVRRPWPRLQVLHLDANLFGEGGAEAMALTAAICLPVLRQLSLSSNMFVGVEELVQERWAALEDLHLGDLSLLVVEAAALARASVARLPKLRRLDLGLNTELGDAGIKALARHPWPHLEELDLQETGIGPRGAEHLAKRAHRFPRLQKLSLRDNPDLGAAGIRALLHHVPWPCLQCLHLDNCGLEVEGNAALAAVHHSQLPALRELFLGIAELSGDGVAALAEVQWRHLEVLKFRIFGSYDEDERQQYCCGVAALAAAGAARFPALRSLGFEEFEMSEEQLTALRAAWPNGVSVTSFWK